MNNEELWYIPTEIYFLNHQRSRYHNCPLSTVNFPLRSFKFQLIGQSVWNILYLASHPRRFQSGVIPLQIGLTGQIAKRSCFAAAARVLLQIPPMLIRVIHQDLLHPQQTGLIALPCIAVDALLPPQVVRLPLGRRFAHPLSSFPVPGKPIPFAPAANWDSRFARSSQFPGAPAQLAPFCPFYRTSLFV